MLVPAAVVARMRRGTANTVENLLRETVDPIIVCAHSIAHDFWRDVDHVGVTHAAAVDDVGHLHARVELVGLHLHGEDGHLRSFHVFDDGSRHIDERAWCEIFEDEGIEGAAALGQLGGD